jgi:hypothetical protein
MLKQIAERMASLIGSNHHSNEIKKTVLAHSRNSLRLARLTEKYGNVRLTG